MRTAKALLAAGALLVGLPSLAHAQWYAGVDAGANFAEKSSVSTSSGDSTRYNTGAVGLGQVGYSFGAPKVEFEAGYRTNDVDKVGGVNGGGSTNSVSLMVNGLYDLLPTGMWHPFLGAGLGMAQVKSNDISQNSATVYSGKQWVFAYQGIAGIGYDLTSNLMAKVQYRYFATRDYRLTDANNVTGHGEYANHSALIGLTYKFNPPPAPMAEPAPAPVAATAPPPPPPAAMPQAQKNFMVFFDFDKAAITSQAQTIITDAAKTSKTAGATRINVTGHTDLAGSKEYNMELSLRRANAVKDALIKQGVPADEIVVTGKGKSDPLVPTKDGVREPQNRRVEIVLQ